MKSFPPLPQGWKGSSSKSSSSAPGLWRTCRPYSTLGFASSIGWESISATPTSSYTVPLAYCIPSSWQLPKKAESENEETWDRLRTRAIVTLNQWRDQPSWSNRSPSYWLPCPRLDEAKVIPTHWVVPGNVAALEEAAIIIQTSTMVDSGLQSSDGVCGRRCRKHELQAMEFRTQYMGRGCSWPPRTPLQYYWCQRWGHIARECPKLVSALNQHGRTKAMSLTPGLNSHPSNNKPLPIPSLLQTKTSHYEDGQTERHMGDDPSCPIPKSGPNGCT